MGAVYELSGNANGAIKAVSGVTKELEKTDKAAKAAATSTTQLERAAQKIKESINPQEKLNRLYKELGEHVKAGRLSIEQATTAGVKFRQELGLAAKAGESVAASGAKAFGGEFLSLVSGAAAGVFSLSGAIGKVSHAFDEMREAARKSVDESFSALNAAGELQQLSENPQQFQAFVGESRSLVRRGIVRPIEQAKAFQTVFNLQSAGFNAGERESLFQAAERKQIADIVGLGGTLRGAQNVFGSADTGDIGETLDKVLQVSKATLENATVTAEQVPKFGSEARALGIDFESSAAAYVAIRKASASAEVASTRERALFAAIDKGGLFDTDLPTTINAIQGKIDAGKNPYDILGNVRAVAGFRALATPEGRAIFAAQDPLVRGAGGSVARQSFLESDPRLSALAIKEAEEGKLAEVTGEKLEERQALLDALEARQKARVRGDNSPYTQGLVEWLLTPFNLLSPPDARGKLQLGSLALPEGDPLRKQIDDYLKRTAEAVESTDRSNRSKVTTRQE